MANAPSLRVFLVVATCAVTLSAMLDEGTLCASAEVQPPSSPVSKRVPRARPSPIRGPTVLGPPRSSGSPLSARSLETINLALPSVAAGVGGYVGIRRRFVFGGDADLF
ncbi:hypothetical protein MTO96_038346 [Rhipicephalus appendiculatus]